MPTVAEVARIWLQSGVSLIPILANGTKKSPEKWARFQHELPTETNLHTWFDQGDYGIALICGRVSGNLEMLELEGRAADAASLNKLMDSFHRAGLLELWAMLNGPDGYSEWSPSGGLHLLYRILDHDVPGNEKVARRFATPEELARDPGDRRKVLAETRGDGGYVITAPTPGTCHPSGESWQLINGQYGQLPLISWDQRCRLHAAIREALDEAETAAVAVIPRQHTASIARPVGRLSPGDDFEARIDWTDDLLLGGAGWTLESQVGATRNWTRPGKDRRDGMSATTGRDPQRDRLYVFSSSTEFEPEIPYTKFGAYALLHHGGDHSAAARELARRGFGDALEPPNPDDFIISPEDRQGKADGVSEPEPGTETPLPARSLDDVGNAERLWSQVRGRFHYVPEEREYYVFDGRRWTLDHTGHLVREMVKVTDAMAATALVTQDEALGKWAKASRSKSKITAAIELMRSVTGVTRRRGDFDPDRHLLNVGNGVLDLNDGTLHPHAARLLMTRNFGADYDSRATCPRFEAFMSEVLPDEEIRAYVQRALGYSLLGDADRRALFLVYGPSGTGKSTLMETMALVFGDYAATAPPGTFKARHFEGPSNDLHGLRGRRFVTSSETAQHAEFDEELLKRISGRDRVVTRELYQQNQTWVPECTLWLATNHPPRFSGDDAIWRRAKLIPFETPFADTAAEVPDMARTVLAVEADGILNWLLAGLASYRELGLAEPEGIKVAAQTHRAQSDSVIQFLEEQAAEGVLVLDDRQSIRTIHLYAMYSEWCRTGGIRPLGSRRFLERAATAPGLRLRYAKTSAGHRVWLGVGHAPNASILGTFVLEEETQKRPDT